MKFRKILFTIIATCFFLSVFLTVQQINGAEGEGSLQLSYSTFFGGGKTEIAWSFVYDDENNIYLTGLSDSEDFPTTPNAYLKEKPGSFSDVFLAKFSNDGSTLLYSSWLGPADHDAFSSFRDIPNIALDSSNNIIVSGTTRSDTFPTTPDAFNQTRNGFGRDMFISILSNDGSSLIYSTYIGGSEDEINGGLSIDLNNNIYVSGYTESNDFPVTTNAYDQSYNGKFDMVILKFSSGETMPDYSTYLGGNETDQTFATELAIDSSNNLIIAGSTRSSDFPVTIDAYDNSYGGGLMIPPGTGQFCCGDIIISKLSENGSNLLYSTFLGGGSGEKVHGMVIDNEDNIYITGSTHSVDFPTTPNAFDSSYNGDDSQWNFFGDIFVTKLNAKGDNIVYSTFVGGSGFDSAESIVLDDSNQVIIAGNTRSEDFPLKGEIDSTQQSNENVIFQLSVDGSSLNNSTYLGGESIDNVGHIDIDNSGNIIIVGYTESVYYPVTSNAWHDTLEGLNDIFIAKFRSESFLITSSEPVSSPSFLGPTIFIGMVFLGRKAFKRKV
ncbi:MAG: SBBP repeat-containing protein [Candidatus Hodarchaeales archaeon]|jgi:hypothetical protein